MSLSDSIVPRLSVVFLGVSLAVATIQGCRGADGVALSKSPRGLAQQVAETHGGGTWRAQQVFAGALHVEFYEPTRRTFDTRFILDTRAGNVRMSLIGVNEKTILVWDGQHAWVSPADAAIERAGDHLRTWPRLISAPFDLVSPGVNVAEPTRQTMAGREYLAATVRADQEPGGATFCVYVDPQTKELQLLAYPTGLAHAPVPPGPLAISFYELKELGGVRLPTQWRFWMWDKDTGIYGKPIGQGEIYNLEFAQPRPELFVKPSSAREEPGLAEGLDGRR